MMIAEILSTGDEIRSGALIDSNSAYIAQLLEASGVTVSRHHSAGDDAPVLIDMIRDMAGRADMAVVTGGLGPTSDDITSAAAATAGNVPLVLDPEARIQIERFFQRIGRPMSASNIKQAYFPDGAVCIENPIGSAPGFQQRIGTCDLFFLPGVPAEMRKMMKESVLPAIKKIQGDDVQKSRIHTLSTFGLTESATGEKLADFASAFPHIKLGFRAKFPEIQVKFYLHGPDHDALEKEIALAIQWVKQRLGDAVFSPVGASMESVVGTLLTERHATLAIAESCTGGLISHLITNVSGSSNYLLYSAVTYANSAKINTLGVSRETLNQYGAVSEQTVTEMALGIRSAAGSDFGLATSGIAGPDGGSDDKPVGTVWIGLATASGVTARQFVFRFKNREANKQIFAMTAMNMLRRELIKEHECN
jgi:nicotinamide-nucleotide amidase